MNKIKEEDIEIFVDHGANQLDGLFIDTYDYEEAQALKQSILDNQEIVERLRKYMKSKPLTVRGMEDYNLIKSILEDS